MSGFGRLAQGTGRSGPAFDPARLIGQAETRLGQAISFDPVGAKGLDLLCTELSALSPGMGFRGKKLIQSALLEALVKRGWVLDLDPQELAPSPARPIFILGPYRSATTFLHRLLAEDPRLRAPRTWEVAIAPIGPEGPLSRSARITQVARYLDNTQRLSPDLVRLHPTGPELAEECAGLLEPGFASASFLFLSPVAGYLDWLGDLGSDETAAAYALYQTGLRALADGPERWVLKCPAHLWGAAALLKSLPDAQIIRLHRDPAASSASLAKLVLANHRLYLREPDEDGTRALCETATTQSLAKAAAALEGLSDAQVFELTFEELTAQPIAALTRIYRWAGLDLRPIDRDRWQRALLSRN